MRCQATNKSFSRGTLVSLGLRLTEKVACVLVVLSFVAFPALVQL